MLLNVFSHPNLFACGRAAENLTFSKYSSVDYCRFVVYIKFSFKKKFTSPLKMICTQVERRTLFCWKPVSLPLLLFLLYFSKSTHSSLFPSSCPQSWVKQPAELTGGFLDGLSNKPQWHVCCSFVMKSFSLQLNILLALTHKAAWFWDVILAGQQLWCVWHLKFPEPPRGLPSGLYWSLRSICALACQGSEITNCLQARTEHWGLFPDLWSSVGVKRQYSCRFLLNNLAFFCWECHSSRRMCCTQARAVLNVI